MEADYFVRLYINHIYFMHRFVWLVCSFGRKKNKRNRHTQSIGCISKKYCNNAVNRFYKVSCNCFGHCIAAGIYGCQQMVAKFSLPDYNKLVAVCISRNINNVDCIVHSKLSIDKGGTGKPGQELENRVINVN